MTPAEAGREAARLEPPITADVAHQAARILVAAMRESGVAA